MEMREMSLEERKKCSKDILCEIDKICKEHSLKYFLAYGTLIGAIRHKGFIPWDDDIDIWVPIEEYKVLLDALENESRYKLISNLNNGKWANPFAKLSDPATKMVDTTASFGFERGVSVDIFPLAFFDDIDFVYKRFRMFRRFCLYSYAAKNRCTNMFDKKAKIVKLIGGIFNFFGFDVSYWQSKIHRLQMNHSVAKYAANLGSPYGKRDIVEKSAYDESIDVNFEDLVVPAPKGYDTILSAIYGDYMELPPEEKRVSNHSAKAFWI